MIEDKRIFRLGYTTPEPTPMHLLEKQRDHWLGMIQANPTGMVDWWAAAAAGLQADIDSRHQTNRGE